MSFKFHFIFIYLKHNIKNLVTVEAIHKMKTRLQRKKLSYSSEEETPPKKKTRKGDVTPESNSSTNDTTDFYRRY